MGRRLTAALGAVGVLLAGSPGESGDGWRHAVFETGVVRGARAADASAESTSLEQYCRSWARNAMMGAKVALQGGTRTLAYINENQLRYLLKHQAAGDQLYLLHGDYTAAEKRYLEGALLAGYDRVVDWTRQHGGGSPDTSSWEAQIHEACMTDAPQAVRAVLAESH